MSLFFIKFICRYGYFTCLLVFANVVTLYFASFFYNITLSLYFQVKIWFQNRRMKWKRSKKAQQESKMKDPEVLNSEKRPHSSIPNSPALKPSASQPVEPTVPNQIPLEPAESSRKCPENEALYRPYVV